MTCIGKVATNELRPFIEGDKKWRIKVHYFCSTINYVKALNILTYFHFYNLKFYKTKFELLVLRKDIMSQTVIPYVYNFFKFFKTEFIENNLRI